LIFIQQFGADIVPGRCGSIQADSKVSVQGNSVILAQFVLNVMFLHALS
jgi:hypothetical protein